MQRYALGMLGLFIFYNALNNRNGPSKVFKYFKRSGHIMLVSGGVYLQLFLVALQHLVVCGM
jgi:hypothetical protein